MTHGVFSFVYIFRYLSWELFLGLMFLPVVLYSQNKEGANNEIISLIESINSQPISISFKNTLQINNQGGHIQGVQYVNYQQKKYYFLSGSSDTYSYYSVIKTGDKNAVISVNKILDTPFKHAGGFQINNKLMAIGIEDNAKKNRSKVFVYQLDDPENLSQKPLKIIERSGAYKRATAGCVGIIELDDIILVVVGNWDTKHLDFYKIRKEKLFEKASSFKLVYTIDTEKMDKTTWVDTSWLSYQNINFLKDAFGKLYLAGMTTNNKGENILDLYTIENEEYTAFKLNKVFTIKFNKSKETSFRWGAGIYLSDDNNLKILSSESQLHKKSKIHVYE